MKIPFRRRILKASLPVWVAMKYGGVLAVGLVVAGCSGGETFDRKSAPEYVTVKTTDFFVQGPMQPGRAVQLPPQEFVKLLRRDLGFSIILLGDGRSGWVDSRNLRPAPPSARAVAEEEIYPERAFKISPLPEPDFKLPIEDVPPSGNPGPSPKKTL